LEKKVQTKDEVLAETDGQHIALGKSLGELYQSRVPHDVRDQVVDLIRRWSGRPRSASGDFRRGWA
jgi:hypothetical protein